MPVLRLLKSHFPQSQIYWWLNLELLGLLENDPDLTGIFPFYREGWTTWARWRQAFHAIRQLRRCEFDWVIDLQGLARSGLVGWLASGKTLVGVEDRREAAFGFYDIAVARPSETTHAVEWYLQVLRRLGVPTSVPFTWLPANLPVQRTIESKWHAAGHQWIALQPGARWLNKRWPLEYFREVIRAVRNKHPEVKFVILGHSGDRPLGEALAAAGGSHCLDLTGRTSLGEMIEWIRLAKAMISNDTGPMHAAAAVKTPLIALFGPTDPRRTGPYHRLDQVLRIDLPCSPCLQSTCHYIKPIECLRAISAGTVLASLDQIL